VDNHVDNSPAGARPSVAGLVAADRERLRTSLDAIDLDSDAALALVMAYLRAARSTTAQK
jgi:hypothetical protein